MTFEDVLIPKWCKYPEPNNGIMGCWSLVSGEISSIGVCMSCDEYIEGEYDFDHIEAIATNQRQVKEYLEQKGES